MAEVVVVGLIGAHDLTKVICSKLNNALQPAALTVLPPEVASPFEGIDSVRVFYSPAIRSIIVQLETPPSVGNIYKTISKAGIAPTAEAVHDLLHGTAQHAGLEFLKAALHLCLSCHLLIWGHSDTTPDATFFQHLQLLQAAKEKLVSGNLRSLPLPLAGSLAKNSKAGSGPSQLLVTVSAETPNSQLYEALDAQVREALAFVTIGSGSPLLEPGTSPGQPCVFLLPDIMTHREAVLAAALHSLEKEPLQPPQATAGEAAFARLKEAAWAIITAAHKVPGCTCLLQAWSQQARRLRDLLDLQPPQLPSERLRVLEPRPEPQDPRVASALQILKAPLTAARRMSAAKCSRAAKEAQAVYENGLPGRYPKSQHEAALRRAFGVFWSKARGVEAGAFARRLHQACVKFWEAERQACDAISLTGQPCQLPPHDSAPADASASDRASDHDSEVTHTVAELSGRFRAALPDPFVPDDANFRLWHPPRQEVRLQRLAMRISCSGEAGKGGSCSKQWAWLSTYAAQKVKLQDLGAWAEGFEPKASRLLVMALPPQPSGATPAVMPDESAAELNTGINLDLEFPPLLAASEPQDGEKSRGSEAAVGAEHGAAYQDLVRSGWPEQYVEPTEERGNEAPRGGRGRRGGRQSGRGRSRPAKPTPTLLIGLEYEGLKDMRVILGPGMLPGRGDCSLSWQLSSNLPLWIEWPAVKTKGGAREAAAEGGDWLQLRRLWFAPPPGPLSFSCCPHLRFQSGSQMFEFQLEEPVPLQSGVLSVVCLPLFYAFPTAWAADSKSAGHRKCPTDLEWSIMERTESANLVAGSACYPT